MKANEREIIFYLEDIILSMERIEEYLSNLNFQEFKWDYKTVDAVVRNFEIIGEASKNLPKEFKNQFPNVPWEEMYRLRNRISHEYFGIDYEILWDIAKQHLPKNHKDVLEILQTERLKKS